MTDKIAEIRKRHAFAEENKSVIRPSGFSWTIPGWQAHNDRATLLAEVERQARHIEELREKIDAERSCACSFDAPGDVCAAHSPALMRARAEVERLRDENARLRAQVGEYFAEPETHPVEDAE